jgi:uncharacterized RDD family membrane protein YckC
MAVTTAQRAPAIAGVAYAGFWIRVLAFLVDGLAIGVIVSLLTLGRGGIAVYDHWLELVAWRNFVETAASFAYFTVLWSWIGGGQTLGMRLFGLHVVGADGQPISIVGAIVRWIGIVISAAMLLLGLVWVAFDPRKQGWHDKLAGSFVVHAGGRTDAVERMPDVGRGTPHPAARGLTVALGLLGAGLGLTGAWLAFAGDAVIQPGNTLTVMTAFAAIALAGSLLAWRLPSITFVVLGLAVVGYWIVLGPLVGPWYDGLLAATATGPVTENQYWFDAPATALFTASAILLAMGSLAALCGVDWSGGRDEVQA